MVPIGTESSAKSYVPFNPRAVVCWAALVPLAENIGGVPQSVGPKMLKRFAIAGYVCLF